MFAQKYILYVQIYLGVSTSNDDGKSPAKLIPSLAYQFPKLKTGFRKALIFQYPVASFALKYAFTDYLKHLRKQERHYNSIACPTPYSSKAPQSQAGNADRRKIVEIRQVEAVCGSWSREGFWRSRNICVFSRIGLQRMGGLDPSQSIEMGPGLLTRTETSRHVLFPLFVSISGSIRCQPNLPSNFFLFASSVIPFLCQLLFHPQKQKFRHSRPRNCLSCLFLKQSCFC